MKTIRALKVFLVCVTLTACGQTPVTEPSQKSDTMPEWQALDYSDSFNWNYLGEGENKPADAFIVPTTVIVDGIGNAPADEETFVREGKANNRLKDIVDNECTIYAPNYRQATLMTYGAEDNEIYFARAYEDIRAAFRYFLDHFHEEGRPLVLMGFSQGGQMVKKLLEEFFAGDEKEAVSLRKDLSAAYVIGYGIETDWLKEYPDVPAASGEDDTCVIVSFDCEMPEVEDSLILQKGEEYAAINPLNWKTDSTVAEASENLGMVINNGRGEVIAEAVNFCGAYLDETSRHALKVTGIEYEDYKNTIPVLPEGSLHSYDFAFFFRNLEKNVSVRIQRVLES